MPTTVRTGNSGDMHAFFPMLYTQLKERAEIDPGYFALRPDAPERFKRWIGPALQDPRHALVVAEEDGALVGFLVATVEQDLPIFVNDEYALVRVVWVDPAHRGKGTACKMLDLAAKELGRFGLRQLRAHAAVAREIEKHVLKKAGFRAAGVTFLRDLRPRRATSAAADTK